MKIAELTLKQQSLTQLVESGQYLIEEVIIQEMEYIHVNIASTDGKQ
jgi:type II secretory pathway component PulL